jgi:NADPH:quinone reductase-like Zn-dependent oxidoreductase
MPDMKAAVIREAGGPEVLKIESRAIPTPQSGEVLIRVKAFGLNRSELFTRQGHSPNVKFPRPSVWSRKRREMSFKKETS